MRDANAQTTGAETTMTTTRFDTLADAFNFSVTGGGVIHRYYGEYHVVPFGMMEWVERIGMKIVHDYSDLDGSVRPTVGESWD